MKLWNDRLNHIKKIKTLFINPWFCWQSTNELQGLKQRENNITLGGRLYQG